MKFVNTHIKDLYIIKTNVFEDIRGSFQKIFNFEIFKDRSLEYEFKEFYFTVSSKNTIRGLHFQIPPHDHVKLVYISSGCILDVSTDLRQNSPTFGKIFSKTLTSTSGEFLYLPKGVAHGFKALENNSIVNYAQTSCYSKEHDMGILFNSIDFDWNISSSIVSERDNNFPTFNEFLTRNPFK
jgi:dTDP-4-dehydrorhamnose 3,5-epimerase